MVRAQASAFADVTLDAHAFNFPSAVESAVTRAAIASEIVWYFSTSRPDGDWSSASFPKRLWPLSTCGGKALPGLVVSPSRSRTVLLYSYVVRRRIGARPGE